MKPGMLLLGNEPVGEVALSKMEQAYTVILKVEGEQEDNSIKNIWIDLSVKIDEAFFQRFPRVETIVCCATGSTNINHHVLRERGVELFNLKPHANFLKEIPATAEHAWALLMAIHSRIVEASESVREGKWDKRNFQRHQLKGMHLGIVGYGRLGRLVGSYGSAFGMKISFSDLLSVNDKVNENHNQIELEELIKSSDYVVLTSSVSPGHEEILDSIILDSVKQGLSLVNVSRGLLVDEQKVLELLERDRLNMYAADVVRLEDISTSQDASLHTFNQLSRHPRVILTPHMGGYCSDARASCENHLIDFLIEGVCPCQ